MLPAGSVWFDAQGAQSLEHRDRGIARYTVEQIRGVMAHAPEAVGGVMLSPRLPTAPSLEFLLGQGVLRWNDLRRPPAEGVPPIWHVVSPVELLQPLETLWPTWARSRATQLVVTLYDIIPLLFEERYLQDPRLKARYLARVGLVRSAHAVLAISQTSAADAIEHLGLDETRVSVIDAGVSDAFAGAFASPEAARRTLEHDLGHIRPGFLLYVGGIDFRKNVERLVEGYARMPADVRAAHQLVIACKTSPADMRRLEGLALAHGARPGEVVLTGYVSDDELSALYHLTALFVFASFYEGSGLPILEAMSCGAPVAAANTSTSPEILGDLDATFDPHDAADIARVLASTLRDPAALERLRARSARRVALYTWDRVAEGTLAGYERVLARAARRASRRPRARIALATPWPPERSGVASYSQRLADALVEHVDVDVYVPRPLAEYPPLERPGMRLLPLSQMRLGAAACAYDDVLYAIGNSDFHHEILAALRETPGTVIAHDVRLGGLYRSLAEREQPDDPWPLLAHWLWQMYGDRLDVTQWNRSPPTPFDLEAHGLYMTKEIQRAARRLVVHSRYPADLLRLDRPADLAVPPPIHIVPHAFPARELPARERIPDLVVCFGVLSPVKGLHELLDAFRLVHAERPRTRLVLAGGSDDPDAEAAWRAEARDHGLADAVTVTGHLSEAEYGELLATAALAVQLRRSSNGEASGTICDCLAAGVPTIATRLGWAAELPEEALTLVPRELAAPSLAGVIAARLDAPSDPPEAARTLVAAHSFAAVARAYAELLGLA